MVKWQNSIITFLILLLFLKKKKKETFGVNIKQVLCNTGQWDMKVFVPHEIHNLM